MKICFFNAIKSWGGGEKWHFETAIGLADKGFDVCAIAGEGGILADRFKASRIPALTSKISKFSFFNPMKIWAIGSYLKKEKVDLVVFNSSVEVKIGVFASKLAGIKAMVYRRGSPTPIKPNLINRFIVKQVSCILCNSEATRLSVLGTKPWIDSRKVAVIYNGVSIPSPQKQCVSGNPKVIMGVAGRLFQEKGHKYLIEALALRDKSLDFELRIAGDGRLKNELVRQVSTLGLESKVRFLGFVEDMDSFYSALDFFVMPSVWEGFGYALVEAMLYGKPAVAFNTGSIPEIITDGVDGYLVTFPDVTVLSQKISALITDKATRLKMGENARQTMRRFSKEKALTKIDELFRQLMIPR
jgi:glycosyltransferase involved in cell wall biosynthesis